MFEHFLKKGYVCYSIREKIKYYKKVINGSITNVSSATRRKAPLRLKSLQKLNSRMFDEPTLIVTNDKHFGNQSKPRLCVVVDKDDKGRLLVAGVHDRTSKAVILDKNPTRQIDERKRWIDSSEVYETKYIGNVKPLTKYDKDKIRLIYKK